MRTVFDDPRFAILNGNKAEQVRIFRSAGCSLTGGLRSNMWRVPYSAPFASICGDGDKKAFAGAFAHITERRFSVTLPPAEVYGGHDDIAAMQEFAVKTIVDFNYHYDLERFDNYEKHLSEASRRNHRRALRGGFRLAVTDDIAGVYAFIAAHHERLGYRMAMSRHDVEITATLLPIDFFYVYDANNRVVGAAIYYRTAPGIAQLINWGDDVDRRSERISNYMAYAIFAHYKQLGFSTVDLGPASTDGIRNEGLCRFKAGLGAIESPKLTFVGGGADA